MINFSKFKATKEEIQTISKIAKRANKMLPSYPVLDMTMDLECAHEETPLKLVELLKTDDANFGHDVFGIRRFLNRTTGKIENHFLPRFIK